MGIDHVYRLHRGSPFRLHEFVGCERGCCPHPVLHLPRYIRSASGIGTAGRESGAGALDKLVAVGGVLRNGSSEAFSGTDLRGARIPTPVSLAAVDAKPLGSTKRNTPRSLIRVQS